MHDLPLFGASAPPVPHSGSWSAQFDEMRFRVIAGFDGRAFTGEHIRFAMLDAGLPLPKNPNAWGQKIKELADEGLIVRVGHSHMKAKRSHGRETPLYRGGVRHRPSGEPTHDAFPG